MSLSGDLSLRYVDLHGHHHSLQASLVRAGFKAGERVVLTEADEVTAEHIEIEIT